MDFEVFNHGTAQVPNEIIVPSPRKVEMYSTDAKYLISVAFIFIVVGAIICGWYIFDYLDQTRQRAALRIDGREAIGEVIRLTHERGGGSYVRYTFDVSGIEYSGKARISNDIGITLHESGTIIIRFLPSDPTTNHPYAWEWSVLMGLDSFVFGLIFMSFGSIQLIKLLRERRLAREGVAVLGVVKSCMRKNRKLWVEYEFHTEDGACMKGSSGSTDQYEAGTSIWILYLPKNHQRNHIYPLSNYRVVE
jgi:hypothetical protein